METEVLLPDLELDSETDFLAHLEGGGLDRLYPHKALCLFRRVSIEDELPGRDEFVLVRNEGLADPDLGKATVRRFRWSERTDADGNLSHVKLELRPHTSDRSRYRTQYLQLTVEEWECWRPYAVMLREVKETEPARPGVE